MHADQRRFQLALLLLILVAAATMRLWQLNQVPPGFTHDEAGHAHDAIDILEGARPIYQMVGYGREPLYDYVVAGLMGLIGPTGFVLRLASVILGLVTLLLTFFWVRLAFDESIALASIALQSVSFWSLSTSRQALRSILLPALFAAVVVIFWRLFKSPRRSFLWRAGHVTLIALFIGATLYTYIPARVLWTALPMFLIYLGLWHRDIFSHVWRPTLFALLVGLLLSVPLFAYLQAHPEAEQRLDMLDAPVEALRQGDLRVVGDRIQSAFSGLLLPGKGDDFLAYTIPGRPVFDWLTGLLFLGGLGICLIRWREPACTFALLWFTVGISPSLITGASAITTRSIGALPVLYLFPSLAAVSAARWAQKRWGRRAGWAAAVGFAGLMIVTGALTVRDYFVTWGQSIHVRAAYQHTLVEIAHYLDAHPATDVVALSSVYPNAPHDPYVFEIASDRRELSLRWFDARRALVVPADATSQLIAPSSASPDAYFLALPGLNQTERITVDPNDLDPVFVLYDWDPQSVVAALREQTQGSALDLPLPVNFGGALQLLGYDLNTQVVVPGGVIELMTLWQVTDPVILQPPNSTEVAAEWVIFAHALGAGNVVVAQEDRLDAPAWSWKTGDVIAQIHRIPLGGDLPLETLELEVGAYRRKDLTRLPVLIDGVVVGDRVLLEPVEMKDS
jgi:hypothetical protein